MSDPQQAPTGGRAAEGLADLFVALQRVLPHHAISRLTGHLAQSRIGWLKNLLVRRFIRAFDVDLTDTEGERAEDFPSFNAFFTRPLKPGARPLPEDPATWCMPADGTLGQFGAVRDGQIVQAKGHRFDLAALVANDPVAAQLAGGAFATVYLSPRDYHRFHMPADGTLVRTLHIPGRLFSVNGATEARLPGLHARNERVVAIFEGTDGPFAVVMVGAMVVAGIHTVYAGRLTPSGQLTVVNHSRTLHLRRGDELGHFQAGSTVITLFPPGVAPLDGLRADQPVRMGQPFAVRRDPS